MNIRELNSYKEVALLKSQLKQTVLLCKAIYEYRAYIDEIKEYLSLEQHTGAQELFEELDYPVQKLLMIAPSKGGPFNTQERATMRALWKISASDIDGSS